MTDTTVPRPDPEILDKGLAAEAEPPEDGNEPAELDQDRLTHLLLTAWTMVLDEEQRKR